MVRGSRPRERSASNARSKPRQAADLVRTEAADQPIRREEHIVRSAPDRNREHSGWRAGLRSRPVRALRSGWIGASRETPAGISAHTRLVLSQLPDRTTFRI